MGTLLRLRSYDSSTLHNVQVLHDVRDRRSSGKKRGAGRCFVFSPLFCIAQLLLLLQLSCAAPGGGVGGENDARLVADIRAGNIFVRPDAAAEIIDASEILRLTPEMRAFAQTHARQGLPLSQRTRALYQAIVTPGLLGAKYDEHITTSAAQAFRLQRANCVGFSNLFVALAREVGLTAHFQDATVLPDWTVAEDRLVINRHLNVKVRAGDHAWITVDVSANVLAGNLYGLRKVSDREAFAQYYNNLGVDALRDGDAALAYHLLLKAIDSHARTAFLWSNMGNVLFRGGHPEHSLAAWRQALRINASETSALANLITVHSERGEQEAVARYQTQLDRHRENDSRFVFTQAVYKFRQGDYAGAQRMLDQALDISYNESLFHELQADLHGLNGDVEGEIEALQRALRFSRADDERLSRLSNRIDALKQ